MRILLINKFLYPKGGDAVSCLATGELLRRHGHKVSFWGMDHPANPDYEYKKYFVRFVDFNKPQSLGEQLKIAGTILYSLEAKQKLEQVLHLEKPDLVHLNIFAHHISPSILPLLKKNNIPTVMTMHEYKLVCPIYTMLLHNKPCERCRNKRFYQCLINRCTKDSYLKSMLNTLEMYLHHNVLRLYDSIDAFIAPSVFLKQKVKEMGFHRNIVYLANFIDLDEFQAMTSWEEESMIYFGRLSKEKGLLTLVDAFKRIPRIVLKIIGEGPLTPILREKLEHERITNVRLIPHKDKKDLHHEIKRSMCAVMPSEWYENNPLAILEAFALGKPVIGAAIGGIPELVKDNETGLLFNPGDAGHLCEKIAALVENKKKIETMGKNARALIEARFNPEHHFEQLMRIYAQAISRHAVKKAGADQAQESIVSI